MEATALAGARQIQTEHEVSHAKKGLLWALTSGMLWGLDGVILGIALTMAPFTGGASLYAAPLAGAAMHDGFAGFWLFLCNLFTGKWKEYGRSLRTKPGLIVCLGALFGGPIAMSGYLMSINMAGASYAMVITAMYPAVGAIMAVFILKERITPRVWLGIAACILGAIIVGYTPPAEGSSPIFYAGLALALIAAFGWGMEGVLSTYGMDLVDSDVAIGIREATSFVVYFVGVLPLVGGMVIFWDTFREHSLWMLALAGLLGGISYLAWYRAFSMTGVGRTMALNITYALWGVFFGWLLTDLEITLNLIGGAAVITLGTILVTANPKELINLRSKE